MERWLEHENGVQALKTWLTLQEEKLKKRNRIEDVASVQNALKDCHVMPTYINYIIVYMQYNVIMNATNHLTKQTT